MTPIIQIENLTKKYNDFIAVNDISLTVFEGEIFGLLGPNGAGKTTTLEIIETLREKDSGNVRINNLSIDQNITEIKKIIGVQLQASGFYPKLTLTEILELFAGLYGKDVNTRNLLNKFDLNHKANSLYKNLSGGQKQRFSIATTLINQPKIIFLDEPTTGLDPQARRSLWETILEIRKQGTTVVITTHYMDEAEYLCDRVAFMDLGKIISIDSPHNLIDQLVDTGFERKKEMKKASLEDVFLHLTGKNWTNQH